MRSYSGKSNYLIIKFCLTSKKEGKKSKYQSRNTEKINIKALLKKCKSYTPDLSIH